MADGDILAHSLTFINQSLKELTVELKRLNELLSEHGWTLDEEEK